MELRSFLLGFSSTILIFILDLRSNDKEDESKEYFRSLYGLKEEYDLIIVGAGLSGSVIAQQASSRSGLTSLVIDKRDHIGGKPYFSTILRMKLVSFQVIVTITLMNMGSGLVNMEHTFSIPNILVFGNTSIDFLSGFLLSIKSRVESKISMKLLKLCQYRQIK